MGTKDNIEDKLSTLVLRAQQGDQNAMAELYDEFANDIYRYALTITRNPDLAEDITSEAFLRAWTHLPTFKGAGGHFRPYLYTIARNYAYDVLKKESRTTSLTENHELSTPKDDTILTAILSEQHKDIFIALGTLSEIQRDIIVLRFFEELTVRETAKILGCSEINVRVMQCRALRKMQKKLS